MTIEDEVAAALERMCKTRDASLKQLVNEALRRGLKEMSTRPKRSVPFHTQSAALGRIRTTGIDNVAEVLAIAEGEAFKRY